RGHSCPGAALDSHERALSQDPGQATAVEPAGGHHLSAFLGMAVGGDGLDPGGADHGRLQDHLRAHRAAATLRRVAGGIGRRGWMRRRAVIDSYHSTNNSHVDAHANGLTQMVIDISSYFAP